MLLVAAAGTVAGCLTLPYLDIDRARYDPRPGANATAPSLALKKSNSRSPSPLSRRLSAFPLLEEMRSVSKFGLSQVVITFADGTDIIYFARQQLISERLSIEQCRARAAPNSALLRPAWVRSFITFSPARGLQFSTARRSERIARLTELRTLHD